MSISKIDTLFEQGEIYYIKKNYGESFNSYLECAKKGNVMAQHNVGFMYAVGCGVAQDINKAIEWYKKSAKQGNSKAYKELAFIYESDGFGKYNLALWLECLNSAKLLNDYEAMCRLGDYYIETEDYDEAYKLFKTASDANDPYGSYSLGNMTLKGDGCEMDEVKALALFEKAGERNVPEAQYKAGLMYYANMGVVKGIDDYAEYKAMSKESNEVGSFYSNSVLAFHWLIKALENGIYYALATLNKISLKLYGKPLLEKKKKKEKGKMKYYDYYTEFFSHKNKNREHHYYNFHSTHDEYDEENDYDSRILYYIEKGFKFTEAKTRAAKDLKLDEDYGEDEEEFMLASFDKKN